MMKFWYRTMKVVGGMLGMVLLVGMMLLLSTPGRSLADDRRTQNIDKPAAIAGKNVAIPGQFVAPSGTDAGFCTDSAQPCKTINYALSKAVDGGEIRVAAGTYKELIQVTRPIQRRTTSHRLQLTFTMC